MAPAPRPLVPIVLLGCTCSSGAARHAPALGVLPCHGATEVVPCKLDDGVALAGDGVTTQFDSAGHAIVTYPIAVGPSGTFLLHADPASGPVWVSYGRTIYQYRLEDGACTKLGSQDASLLSGSMTFPGSTQAGPTTVLAGCGGATFLRPDGSFTLAVTRVPCPVEVEVLGKDQLDVYGPVSIGVLPAEISLGAP